MTPDSGEDCTVEVPQTPDEVFEVLRAHRRRLIITFLADHDVAANEAVTLSELAEYIAAQETNTPRDAVDSASRKSAYVTLYQVHLDTLESAEVIKWDQRSGEVTPDTGVDGLARLIDAVN